MKILALAALSLASIAAVAQIPMGPPCKPGPGVTCGIDLSPNALLQSGIVSFRK